MRTFVQKKIELLLVALLLLSTLINAQSYWVGGSGDWSDASHWSATDGGQGGVGIPNRNTDANFTSLSGLNNNDFVNIDSIAHVRHLDFSGLNKSVILKGPSRSNILITGKIIFSEELINQYQGYAIMVGSNSDYRPRVFKPGEFNGKYLFIDVYKNKRNLNQLLSGMSVVSNPTDATCACNGKINLTVTGGIGPLRMSGFRMFRL